MLLTNDEERFPDKQYMDLTPAVSAAQKRIAAEKDANTCGPGLLHQACTHVNDSDVVSKRCRVKPRVYTLFGDLDHILLASFSAFFAALGTPCNQQMP